MKRYLVLMIGFWLFWSGEVSSQAYIENDSTYTFFLKEGMTITGKVKVIEDRKSYGIKSGKKWKVIYYEDIIDFYYPGTAPDRPSIEKRPNHHEQKYFIMPSSYGLKKGDVYYQNDYLLIHKLSFGLSDYVTMGIGILPLLLFDVDASLVISLTPKFNYHYKNGNGACALYGGIATNQVNYPNDDLFIYSIHFSNTFGPMDKQLTIGGGYLYGDDLEDYRVNIFANGLIRTGNRWSFIMENHYFFSENLNFNTCIGFRYMPKRFSLTLGMWSVFFDSYAGIAPWLSMGYKFK